MNINRFCKKCNKKLDSSAVPSDYYCKKCYILKFRNIGIRNCYTCKHEDCPSFANNKRGV